MSDVIMAFKIGENVEWQSRNPRRHQAYYRGTILAFDGSTAWLKTTEGTHLTVPVERLAKYVFQPKVNGRVRYRDTAMLGTVVAVHQSPTGLWAWVSWDNAAHNIYQATDLRSP